MVGEPLSVCETGSVNRAVVMNVVAYQCAWFACVLGAAAQHPAIGMIMVAGVIAWHLRSAPEPRRELRLIGVAVLCGLAFETVLAASGWVRMEPSPILGKLTPLWMVALWAAFATTLNVSLRAFRARYLLSAVLAGIGAPLAYHAGAGLGALHWVEPAPALVLIAVGWAMLMPLLMNAAQRFDGFATP
jgi:hypothetical protein